MEGAQKWKKTIDRGGIIGFLQMNRITRSRGLLYTLVRG